MGEAEALCDRLGIFVGGHLRCVGSAQVSVALLFSFFPFAWVVVVDGWAQFLHVTAQGAHWCVWPNGWGAWRLLLRLWWGAELGWGCDFVAGHVVRCVSNLAGARVQIATVALY